MKRLALIFSLAFIAISCSTTHELAKYNDYVLIYKDIIAPDEWYVVIKNDKKVKEFRTQTWFVNYYQIGDTIK